MPTAWKRSLLVIRIKLRVVRVRGILLKGWHERGSRQQGAVAAESCWFRPVFVGDFDQDPGSRPFVNSVYGRKWFKTEKKRDTLCDTLVLAG